MFSILSMTIMLIFELTLINRAGLIAEHQLYPETIVQQFKRFIMIFGSIQIILGGFAVLAFTRNEAVVTRETRQR
jgi:hypothetical protein